MPEDPKIPFSAGQPQHLFKGPANWFTLRVPGDLHIEQTEAFLEVHPAAVSVSEDAEDLERRFPWSMTLYAAWVDDNEPETRAASFDPANLFPKVLSASSCASTRFAGVAVCRTPLFPLFLYETDNAWQNFAEGRLHLRCVVKSFVRLELNRFPQPSNQPGI
jgi:hypothetical protein